MEHRFSRTELLIGREGLSKLAASRVAIFGLGGVGSFAAEALARSGVGSFVLVDFDVVSLSNINRQLHALEDTLGRPKVRLMAERMAKINPECRIRVFEDRYLPGEGDKFFVETPDYVVDAVDDVEAKVDLLKMCVQKKIPVVSSMGAGNKLDPTAFKVTDISKTSVCPLARALRRRLRQEGIESGVKVVYSTEQPCVIEAYKNGAAFQKKIPGSISFVPSAAGLILAGLVVTDLNEAEKGF